MATALKAIGVETPLAGAIATFGPSALTWTPCGTFNS